MFEWLRRFFNKRQAPGTRVLNYLQPERALQVYIGIPANVNAPRRWVRVTGADGDTIRCEDGHTVNIRFIQSFIVAYSNGELLDWKRAFLPWPEGIHEPEQIKPVVDTITLDVLRAGERLVRVTHGMSVAQRAGKHNYSTTLTNTADQRVKVLRFAGYTHTGGSMYRLQTITGGYFTAEQFRAWYGLNEREWIDPGQSACDPENYGGPGALWAYFCQTESGEEFVVGAVAS